MTTLNKRIKAYNLNLIRNDIYHDINTYYKLIIKNFYKSLDANISEFLNLIIENDEVFIINGSKLIEYGIFDSIENIYLYLEINNLKPDKDYIVREIQLENNQIKNDYILTPDTFKLCAL